VPNLQKLKKASYKCKNNILKQWPDAKLIARDDGGFVISINDYIPADEYLLPTTTNKTTAWEYAQLSLKTTQNFNRTHPNRLDMLGFEHKLNRINNRRSRAKKNKKSR